MAGAASAPLVAAPAGVASLGSAIGSSGALGAPAPAGSGKGGMGGQPAVPAPTAPRPAQFAPLTPQGPAQASRAGAFGGSRHGVAEALTNEAFARQGAQTFGNLQLGQQQARMQGAAQMGQLGQQAFNIGQTIQQQQAQQGLLQQGLQQALIDAARGQYQGYVGSPQQALQAPLSALGVVPVPQTTTKSKQPGFFDYATLAATAAAGM